MYLNEKEADLISGVLMIEFSEKELVALARSLDDIIKFNCTDEELQKSEITINTLLSAVPKSSLLTGIKSVRPDLSIKINKLL
jgi:Asp-tRNA(Asn)/Glu-tRNA(Gln) amidotransferase C subunit